MCPLLEVDRLSLKEGNKIINKQTKKLNLPLETQNISQRRTRHQKDCPILRINRNVDRNRLHVWSLQVVVRSTLNSILTYLIFNYIVLVVYLYEVSTEKIT